MLDESRVTAGAACKLMFGLACCAPLVLAGSAVLLLGLALRSRMQ